MALVGQSLDHVFDDHDRPVDQNADGNGQPPQAHQVGGEADGAHEDEGQQRRHRQRQRHDYRGAQIAQEQQQQDHDQDRRFDQGGFDRADGGPDQVRPVIEHVHVHARRQAGLDLFQPLLDPVDQLAGIRAAQADDQPLHRLALAVLADRAVTGQASGAHGGDIADPHHRAAIGPHDHGRQILQRPDRAGGADDQRFLASGQAARAVVVVVRLDRGDQVGRAEARRRQRAGTGGHFKRFGIATQRIDVRHAGHGAQSGADRPVQHAAFFGQRLRPFQREHEQF